eukprot:CAMPEP_0184688694 /NCGR_PEP_ID=MMETSP0312-20130426/30238_1 /TAXON_ID=31354 /ORGANISM="Compsopogon coeruleus, Strain SAG 36.94" /LENGTH=87 /DNA_ID=CAMNT_0027145953 /DNA_START=1876 /DNA_END=2137 /DNA_ORIENTATION=-
MVGVGSELGSEDVGSLQQRREMRRARGNGRNGEARIGNDGKKRYTGAYVHRGRGYGGAIFLGFTACATYPSGSSFTIEVLLVDHRRS